MSKFSGVLICTDLDGTLFRNDKTVSEENLRVVISPLLPVGCHPVQKMYMKL